MSDLTPSRQPPVTWEEWHGLVHGWLQDSMGHLHTIGDDEREPLSLRLVALQVARTANAAGVALSLLTGLGNVVAQLQDIVHEVIDRADLDEAARAEILERIQHLEYATVAEGQLDRIMEQLKGDLEDRLGDRLAGRLRGEEAS